MTWFAPWRWFAGIRPWKKWTIAVIVLLIWYIESPIVIVPIMNRSSIPLGEQFIQGIYAPLIACYEVSPAVHVFYDTQFEAVDETLTQWGW